jgi:hypothetical protein
MSTLKKIFFLSLFVFFLSLLFWGIYMLSFKKTTTPTNTNLLTNKTTNNIPSGDLPVTNSNTKISVISNEIAISPILSSNENKIWYYSVSGELKETDFIGNIPKKLTNKKIIGLLEAIWSPNKSSALLKVNKSGFNYFILFNMKSEKISTLANNIDSASWLTTSDKIIYKYFNPNNHQSSLNISKPDGSNWKKILNLPHNKFNFSQIPRSGLISFWNFGDAYFPTLFQSIPSIGGDTKTLYKDTFGNDYLWNNSGSNFLVSQTNAKGGTKLQLGVANYNGEEYNNLGLPTFISKCLWSKDNITIYCALPGDIPDNSILPNDYKAGKFKTSDTFWKINTITGEKSRLIEATNISGNFDASNLFSNSDESLIFFLNKRDGKLYKITL